MQCRVFHLLAMVTMLAIHTPADAAASDDKAVKALPREAGQLYADSMRLSASSFDGNAHLIVRPVTSFSNAQGHFMVRESSWYALGLLMRDQPGDRAEAAAILQTVLANQYRTPGTKWMGTFKRTPEEPEPTTSAIAFRGYDPNWRQFIGTTFQMILIEYPDRIPQALAKQLYDSIDLAVTGELQDGRLKPTYSNIALMHGALWDFAAQHSKNSAWQSGSVAWTTEVDRLFRLHNTFFEYNSPTYYGVDLYGLALWRRYGSTPTMRAMGAAMEAALWTDIADYYQPKLRNITGPYDRAYGMDMESYVSVTGVWMRTILGQTRAPLPQSLSLKSDHIADLWFAPQIVLLGAQIPPAARAKLVSFAGPHLVTRQIDAQRTATAWVGADAIWGGEATSLSKDVGEATQFHPVTVQWRTPTGSIGWIQLTRSANLNAVADAKGVTIDTTGDVSFLLHAASINSSQIAGRDWTLPGIDVGIETDAASSSKGSQTSDEVAITYKGVHHLRLQLQPQTGPPHSASKSHSSLP